MHIYIYVIYISLVLLALRFQTPSIRVSRSNFPLIPSSFGTNTLGYQRSTLQQVSKSVLLQYPEATIRVPNWKFDMVWQMASVSCKRLSTLTHACVIIASMIFYPVAEATGRYMTLLCHSLGSLSLLASCIVFSCLFLKFFYDLCLSIPHLQNLGLPTSLAVEVFCMWLFGIALQTRKAFATAETTGLKTSRAAENEMWTWLVTDDVTWDTDRICGSPISKTSEGGNESR